MGTTADVMVRARQLRAQDVDWLHLLIGDWQLIADLSFADLVLWVRVDPGAADPDFSVHDSQWVVASHVRPNTGPLVFFDDIVGSRAGAERRRLLDACAQLGQMIFDTDRDRDEVNVRQTAIPVVRSGKVLAVLTRHSNVATGRIPSRLELTYLSLATQMLEMIAAGAFPTLGAPTGQRRGAPRVGDGVVSLDYEGVVTYASPNAISAIHRIGHPGPILGEQLSRIVSDLLEDHTVVDESLVLVVTGKAPWRSEIDAHGASLSLRAIPLTSSGVRTGAMVLLRDVSELRRRERELMTKDATIREIHHRVKNNLQTVAALLRLQSRRVEDEGARAALSEAGRRIATIALVHDTLSRTIDEDVDFDDVLTRALNAVVEVATDGPPVDWVLTGTFGRVGAEDATSLAMVLTELVQNAAEHGLAGIGGSVVIDARRGVKRRLSVTVTDDGVGLPENFRPGRSGLGTQIVSALVEDLRGRITWERVQPHGTRVTFTAKLRTVKPARQPESDELDEGGDASG
ncbi:two-component sensor histidine kinase [Kineosphaera limosa]|uniref:sensor histidine kinase n=1 Tax=Kineosphaera limosa TaxID=111564 RepID=UPI0002DAB6D1|nr:sensor histidine kinase [Kineosphaera limosa]NYE02607.1 two-component sensor histidine kinase [Kineosphaera limosa]